MEILGLEEVVILPRKIDSSNFNQGFIGDCYFLSCVNALSRIPQLLHFIMGLTLENNKNEPQSDFFIVKFFIDGEWKNIKIKDSFPCYIKGIKGNKCKYELIGVQPESNELFLMIFENRGVK